MLTEDQMFLISDRKKAKVSIFHNSWRAEGSKTNHVHLFSGMEQKEVWVSEFYQMHKRLNECRSQEISIEQRIRDAVLNESNTKEEVEIFLSNLRHMLDSFDWNDAIETKQKILDRYLGEDLECIGCKQKFPSQELYSVSNSLPVKRDYSIKSPLYCVTCLSDVYELLFPYCVICNCRHEVNDVQTIRDFCRRCGTAKLRDERNRVRNHLERAKSYEVLASLTLKQWLATLDYFEWKCAYCEGEFQALEHYKPLPLGGTTIDNCLPSCSSCNARKRNYIDERLDAIFPAENLQRIREWLQSQPA